MSKTNRLIMAALLLGTASCESKTEEAVENVAVENAVEADANATGEGLVFCPVVERRISGADCEDLKRIDAQVERGTAAFNVPSPMTRDKTKSITLVVDRRSPEEVAAIETGAAAGEEPEVVNDVSADVAMNAVDVADANAVDEVAVNAVEGEPTTIARETPNPRPTVNDPTPGQLVEGLEGSTEKMTPKVGRYMSADLLGDGFKIEALSERSQEIPPDSQATWQWNVTPTAGGTHNLTLKTIVEGEVGGKRYALTNTQEVRTVEVKVSWLGRLWDFLSGLPEWLKVIGAIGGPLAAVIYGFHLVRRAWRGQNPNKPAEKEPEKDKANDE